MRLTNYLNKSKQLEDFTVDFLGKERPVKNELDTKVESVRTMNPYGHVTIYHYVYVEEYNKYMPLGKSWVELKHNNEKGWHLTKIHVDDNFRRKGLGTFLVKKAVELTGSSLRTTEVLSDHGKSLIRSLVKRGIAKKTDKGHVIKYRR